MSTAVIVSGTRTAIGSFGGALSETPVSELGRVVIESALKRAGIDPNDVEEVIMGNVLQAGAGMNAARQSAIAAGIPDSVPSFTVNKVCGSGLKAVALAAQAIAAGDADVIVSGGMESMSRAPYLLRKARTGYRLGNDEIIDSMLSEGLTCAMANCHMGVTAENIARSFAITREMQDQFAAESQRRAEIATAEGRFEEEITPVLITKEKGETIEFKVDEYPRTGTVVSTLGKLKPAFQTDGTVTAGNASGINDGAAAVVVASEERARLMELTPLAKIVSYASAGVDPRLMGMGPIPAIERALEKAGLETKNIDLFELNEAFAAQSLAVLRKLSVDDSRVNVNGGAIALGHPIGASGTRVLVTLLYEMKRRDARRGLASLCIGGGQGIAMIVER